MKTSASWSPTPSLNVVSVQLGEQAWTVTVDNESGTELGVAAAIGYGTPFEREG